MSVSDIMRASDRKHLYTDIQILELPEVDINTLRGSLSEQFKVPVNIYTGDRGKFLSMRYEYPFKIESFLQNYYPVVKTFFKENLTF